MVVQSPLQTAWLQFVIFLNFKLALLVSVVFRCQAKSVWSTGGTKGHDGDSCIEVFWWVQSRLMTETEGRLVILATLLSAFTSPLQTKSMSKLGRHHKLTNSSTSLKYFYHCSCVVGCNSTNGKCPVTVISSAIITPLETLGRESVCLHFHAWPQLCFF